jgi:hypothetical protein
MELFEIAGNQLYLDLEEISEFVRIDEDNPNKLDQLFSKEKEDIENDNEVLQGPLIDMTRWELVKGMIETVLSEQGIVDEDMGLTMLGKQLSIPCKLSLNTLIKHKLIKNNNK